MIDVIFYEFHPQNAVDETIFSESADPLRAYLHVTYEGNIVWKEHTLGWTVYANDISVGKVIVRQGKKVG